MYKLIKENYGLESAYPNVNIVQRIFLSLNLTNCSGEMSFSKLKCVKNQQRTSLGQDKLNYLTLLSIKHELLNEIEVKDIIKSLPRRGQENDLCKLKSHATSCSHDQFFLPVQYSLTRDQLRLLTVLYSTRNCDLFFKDMHHFFLIEN